MCVGVRKVQCNCRQSQPYLPVKNTIIPHGPSQAISAVVPSLFFLSFSASNYKLEGYFSSGQKHCPPALPLSSDHPLFLSLSCPYSLSQQLQSGNEQAVNTHHLAPCMWVRICQCLCVCEEFCGDKYWLKWQTWLLSDWQLWWPEHLISDCFLVV